MRATSLTMHVPIAVNHSGQVMALIKLLYDLRVIRCNVYQEHLGHRTFGMIDYRYLHLPINVTIQWPQYNAWTIQFDEK